MLSANVDPGSIMTLLRSIKGESRSITGAIVYFSIEWKVLSMALAIQLAPVSDNTCPGAYSV
jgi:hypothetical protein